jgi:hypothetical protein
MAKGLSKSRYTQFRLCDKALWLSVFKPEAAVITDAQQAIFDTGSEVGDLAMGLLGDFEEMTTVDPNGQLDKGAMIEKTKDAMARGVVNICEAAFSFEGNYCAVDILHKTDAGYEIYEVKSSTSPDKEIYGWDVAYQKYVLTGCGLNVTGTYLVSINNQYVLQGDLDLQQLFKITDISKAVDKEIGLVDGNVKVARNVLAGGEPDTPLSMGCHKPYDCQFWEYCTRELPKPSVFDVKGLHFDKKIALHNAGRDTFESIQDYKLNKIQRMQVECTLKGTASIDKAKIQAFLDPFTDRFPLYYLDFESIQPAIPIFDGTHPYQQLTTQFSLHIQETPRGKVTHKEFLAPSKGNPLRPVAEALCAFIPKDACVIVYSKTFEGPRLRELSEMFPDLKDHLLAIRDNIVDLLVPFEKGFYYLPAMGGRSSIKSVLPALFPNDPQLDYHALDDICQNGGDAKSLFPKLQNMSTEDEAKARRALLDYCCLDTLAMVKVMDKLYEAVEE